MNELTDPREMRKAINEMARGYYFDQSNKPQFTASMVRAVLMAGERAGWSGEDTMTALAYMAIQQAEKYAALALDMHSTKPPAPILWPAEQPSPERAKKEQQT